MWVIIWFLLFVKIVYLHPASMLGFLLGIVVEWSRDKQHVWTYGAYPKYFNSTRKSKNVCSSSVRTAVHISIIFFQELVSQTAKWSSITLPQLVGYETYLTTSYGVPLCSSTSHVTISSSLSSSSTASYNNSSLHSFKLAANQAALWKSVTHPRPDGGPGIWRSAVSLDLNKTV